MKKEREKSDPSIVAKRPANKPKVSEVDLWACGAESAEPREGAEGNTGEQHTCRILSREMGGCHLLTNFGYARTTTA
jgi:RNA-directed DNA polymerase